jgi:hypothetical protein
MARRLAVVIGLALVICALTAGSAGAQVLEPALTVGGPNNGAKGNGGQSTNHAPSRDGKTCIPIRPGTVTAILDAGAPPIVVVATIGGVCPL